MRLFVVFFGGDLLLVGCDMGIQCYFLVAY